MGLLSVAVEITNKRHTRPHLFADRKKNHKNKRSESYFKKVMNFLHSPRINFTYDAVVINFISQLSKYKRMIDFKLVFSLIILLD